jgi:hypothetical protein
MTSHAHKNTDFFPGDPPSDNKALWAYLLMYYKGICIFTNKGLTNCSTWKGKAMTKGGDKHGASEEIETKGPTTP